LSIAFSSSARFADTYIVITIFARQVSKVYSTFSIFSGQKPSTKMILYYYSPAFFYFSIFIKVKDKNICLKKQQKQLPID